MKGKANDLAYADLSEEHRWAIDAVKVFEYRKTFGLSSREFYEEELAEQYFVNSLIMNEMARIKEADAKRAKRKAKHGPNRR